MSLTRLIHGCTRGQGARNCPDHQPCSGSQATLPLPALLWRVPQGWGSHGPRPLPGSGRLPQLGPSLPADRELPALGHGGTFLLTPHPASVSAGVGRGGGGQRTGRRQDGRALPDTAAQEGHTCGILLPPLVTAINGSSPPCLGDRAPPCPQRGCGGGPAAPPGRGRLSGLGSGTRCRPSPEAVTHASLGTRPQQWAHPLGTPGRAGKALSVAAFQRKP